MPTRSGTLGGPARQVPQLDRLLVQSSQADEKTRPRIQTTLFGIARDLLSSEEGLELLYDRAEKFDAAGVFVGGPWADPSALQAPLVGGTLRAPGVTPIVESLSELRMLAIAKGRASSDRLSPKDALGFLDEILARNLRYLFPSEGSTEEEREGGDPHRASHERLFSLIVREIGIERVIGEVVDEVDQVLAQRPISTWGVRRMILRAMQLVRREALEGPAVDALERYHDAVVAPSPLAQANEGLRAYRDALGQADRSTLESEARACADAMHDTGLVAPHQAVLVRRILQAEPDLLPLVLGVGEAGAIEIHQNAPLLDELIEAAIFPTTAQSLYGLSAALERTLLSRTEVAAGLERLIDLEIRDDVRDNLLARRSEGDAVTANGVLLAGSIAVLGQPLGVGQGRNPTCQSARGISLWAQHDPAHLLELVVAAARDGRLEFTFDAHRVYSDQILKGVATEIDLDLDPVSIVLVPHLDRLYSEFMRRSALRTEDAHKWVNPALYGRWVQNELASAFVDLAQTTVSKFDTFVRRFFATHHLDFNGGHRLMYPNPVGLVVTNHAGKYLGPHAVSIQRVDVDPEGVVRVYFYNPNNEGRQDWGNGVVVSVRGKGEEPGESSLQFDDFAARIYAFHYNPHEEGDHAQVPDERVAGVVEAARKSWGERFIWLDAPLV